MLTDSDREALAVALRTCRVEDGAPVRLLNEADVYHVSHMLLPAVEAIVAAHVTAALSAAADAIEAGVLPSHPNRGYRDGFARAASIVRAAAP